MRVTIFGATGPTGRRLVVAALNERYRVRALARNPSDLAPFGAGIEVVAGDVLDEAAVQRAVKGADVVLSSLGTGTILKPTTVMSQGTHHIIRAMHAEGVRRVLAVTSAMITPTGQEPFFFRSIGRYVLRHVHADHLRLEEALRASGLDWTTVRPPRLLDGPARGAYRVAREAGIPGGNTISRADLALFMVREAAENRFLHCGVSLSY